MELKIEYISINDIKPYPRNAKLHPQNQINQIKQSIEFFGFDDPIAIWGNGEIIEGHGRYIAAQQLGMETVPIIRLDGLTDEQRRAYALIHNKLTMNSGFDIQAMNIELSEIHDFRMEDFSFEIEPETLSSADVTDDEYNTEPQKETSTKLGDVYSISGNTIICGDTFGNLEKAKGCDVIIWDPPFEAEDMYFQVPKPERNQVIIVLTDYKHFGAAISGAIKAGWYPWYEFIWDNVQSWYTQNRPLAQHKTCFVFGAETEKRWNFDGAIVKDGKKRTKSHSKNAANRGEYYYEPLDGAKHLTTVFQQSSTQMHDEHGQGKPVQWIAAILAGLDASSVFDAFCGSGTALIACEQLHIPCISVDIEPKYIDQAIERIEKYTEKKAVLVQNGDGDGRN